MKPMPKTSYGESVGEDRPAAFIAFCVFMLILLGLVVWALASIPTGEEAERLEMERLGREIQICQQELELTRAECVTLVGGVDE